VRSSSETNLKSRITRLLWVGNALLGGFVALVGAMTSSAALGDNTMLSLLTVRIGALLAAVGLALTVFSVWRARSSATR